MSTALNLNVLRFGLTSNEFHGRETILIHRWSKRWKLQISLSDLRWAGILIKSLVNPLISVLFFYPRRFRELKLVRTTWKFIHYPTIIFTIDFRRFFYPTRFFRISARGWGWRKNPKTQLKKYEIVSKFEILCWKHSVFMRKCIGKYDGLWYCSEIPSDGE